MPICHALNISLPPINIFVLQLKNRLCPGLCQNRISISPWSHVHQHPQTTTDIEHVEIWECKGGKTYTLTILFDITFGPLKEWAGRLDFHDWYGAPRRPFIPGTCSHFVLAIQEEPPCGRQPSERALLLPVKRGAPLWTILMREWDTELAGRGRDGGRENGVERGETIVSSVTCVYISANTGGWLSMLASAMAWFNLYGASRDLHCPLNITSKTTTEGIA